MRLQNSHSLHVAGIGTKVNAGHGFPDEVVDAVQEVNRLRAQPSEANAICLDVIQCVAVGICGCFHGNVVDRATLKVKDGCPDLGDVSASTHTCFTEELTKVPLSVSSIYVKSASIVWSDMRVVFLKSRDLE